MANTIPKEVKKEIVDAWIAEATWGVCLLTSAFTYVSGTHITYADLFASGAEVVGTGYVQGGATLAGRVGGYSGTDYYLDAADTQWLTATLSNVQYIAVYHWTGVSANSRVRFIYDLGTTYSVTAGTFTIQWNASGLVTVS